MLDVVGFLFSFVASGRAAKESNNNIVNLTGSCAFERPHYSWNRLAITKDVRCENKENKSATKRNEQEKRERATQQQLYSRHKLTIENQKKSIRKDTRKKGLNNPKAELLRHPSISVLTIQSVREVSCVSLEFFLFSLVVVGLFFFNEIDMLILPFDSSSEFEESTLEESRFYSIFLILFALFYLSLFLLYTYATVI